MKSQCFTLKQATDDLKPQFGDTEKEKTIRMKGQSDWNQLIEPGPNSSTSV